MSDERDDASDSPEDAADHADQSDPPPDANGERSSESGDGIDSPGTADDPSDAGDDDAGSESGRGPAGDAGVPDAGAGEDAAAETDGDSEAADGDEVDSGGEKRDADTEGRSERAAAAPGDDGGNGGGPGNGENGGRGGADPERVQALAEELGATREHLADLESRVDEKTVHRDDVMAELKRYVRARQRRGHATGWGPYLVLLYGTAMSLGAFYYLGGWPVIAALVVIWLSTLGLFVVMLLAGALVGAGRKLGSARDVVGMLRR